MRMTKPCTLIALVGCAALTAALTAAAAPAVTADDAIQLSWDGDEYADTTRESFLGLPVVVPGDHSERTLTVRNDGESAGVLAATIDRVELLDAAIDDSFYDDVTIEWRGGEATLADLRANGETPIAEVPLEQGETTTISIGYDFPVDSVSGNSSEVGARSASFDVLLSLGGNTEPEPAPVPEPEPDPEPQPAPTPEPDALPEGEAEPEAEAVPEESDPLAPTGGQELVWIALASGILIPLGLLLMRVRRTRQNE